MSNNDHKPRLAVESGTNAGSPIVNGPNSFPFAKIGPDGYANYKNRNNRNNNDEDHATKITSSGCFECDNFDSDPKRNCLNISLNPGSQRDYFNNSCTTTNANGDNNFGKNSKCGVGGECGHETKRNHLTAIGDTEFKLAKRMVGVTPKTSQNNNERVTSGNDNEKVTGSKNCSVEKDCFHSTGESRYDIVKNGEYGINVQSGNMDIQLDSGKARIDASQEILLTCGSSYIMIRPDRIEIVADRIDLNPAAKEYAD